MNLAEALHAYRTFDPRGWVLVFLHLPAWTGLLGVAFGLALLLGGGGRGFRLLAGPLAAVSGLLWLRPLAQGLELPASVVPALSVGGSFVLATASFAFPHIAVFIVFGLPAGLLVGELMPRGEWLVGFTPTFLVVGAVTLMFHRVLASAASSLAGGWLWVLGLLTLLKDTQAAQNIARHPNGIYLAVLLFAAAGVVYQLGARPSPEQADEEQRERLRRKREEKEKRALEERWSNYSKRSGRS